MNERIKELANQSRKVVGYTDGGYTELYGFDHEKFAELIVQECISVAQRQRNPSNLNYKPSERFVEDLRQHFGVKV